MTKPRKLKPGTCASIATNGIETREDRIRYMDRMLQEIKRDGTRVYRAGWAVGYGYNKDDI